MANQIVVEALSGKSTTVIQQMLDDALSVYMNGGTITRSYEGSSLTIDLKNAETVVETAKQALDFKRASANGCQADLEQRSNVIALDFSRRMVR